MKNLNNFERKFNCHRFVVIMFFKKEEEKKDEEQKMEKARAETTAEELAKEITKGTQPQKTEKEIAPLFVKIEKYKEVITNIQEVKILLKGLKNVFNLLYEIEQVRNDAVKLLSTTLQRIERSLIELDASLLRPGEFEPYTTSDMGSIEQALSQLTQQLSALRSELEKTKEGGFKA